MCCCPGFWVPFVTSLANRALPSFVQGSDACTAFQHSPPFPARLLGSPGGCQHSGLPGQDHSPSPWQPLLFYFRHPGAFPLRGSTTRSFSFFFLSNKEGTLAG